MRLLMTCNPCILYYEDLIGHMNDYAPNTHTGMFVYPCSHFREEAV